MTVTVENGKVMIYTETETIMVDPRRREGYLVTVNKVDGEPTKTIR